jgi:hypothetical protein
MHIWKALSACILFAAVNHIADAQATTSLGGRVTDPSGAVVSGAHVKVVSAATSASRETTTNSSGEYQFSQLAPGKYNLLVSAQGFERVQKSGLDLLVSQPATVNVALGVAGVTVQRRSNHRTSSPSSIPQTQPSAMPSTTDPGRARSPSRAATFPTSSASSPASLISAARTITIGHKRHRQQWVSDSRSGAVNGGRSDQSNITLDGVDVNDINNGYAFTSVLRVTQDSIAEFRVTTSESQRRRRPILRRSGRSRHQAAER